MAPDYRSEDAYQFFQCVRREGEYVSAKLTKIHDEFSAKYLTDTRLSILNLVIVFG